MYPEERQQQIVDLVAARGRVSVTELAEAHAVTTETVRRDLAVLDREGLVQRVHGGAVPARTRRVIEPGIDERETIRTRQKDAIAAAAVQLLPSAGGTVLLDAGTTTARIVGLLPTDRELVVVTNSVPIAARLATIGSVNLHLLGGRVRGLTHAAVGEAAVDALRGLRVDIAFLGSNGITVQHGLSTPDSTEAAVKRAMVQSANYVVAVADSTKIGREEFVSFADIDSVDTIITDDEIGDADRATLIERGVELIVTECAL